MGDREQVVPAVPVTPKVITLPAEIDLSNTKRIGADLMAALAPGVIVVADLSGTSFCDSSGVRMLALADKRAAACHGELRLAAATDGVLRILELTGLDAKLKVYPDVRTAVRG